MNLDSYDIAIIGISGTIIGTLLGAFSTYRFSLKLAETNRRQDASNRLIRAFANELSEVYPTPVNWPNNIDAFLKSKFNNLQAAICEFRYILPTKEWKNFDSLWFKYYCSTGREIDRNCQCYSHYIDSSGASTDKHGQVKPHTQNGREALKLNIDNLLSFAKKT
ncbi:MAG: hypothetical protein LUQ26_05570 [Methylococcaceae bacterium]|nr:hypothetical protein [Methylococcaceae bacterium]